MSRLEDELQMTFQSEGHKAMLNILFTANCLRHISTGRFAVYGLSPSQYNILRILNGAKGKAMCMHQIKDRLLDRAPNATRLTDKLISKKLVVRERSDDDRRMVFLAISEKGRALLKQIDSEGGGPLALHEKLTEAESRVINAALDRLREHL